MWIEYRQRMQWENKSEQDSSNSFSSDVMRIMGHHIMRKEICVQRDGFDRICFNVMK